MSTEWPKEGRGQIVGKIMSDEGNNTSRVKDPGPILWGYSSKSLSFLFRVAI